MEATLCDGEAAVPPSLQPYPCSRAPRPEPSSRLTLRAKGPRARPPGTPAMPGQGTRLQSFFSSSVYPNCDLRSPRSLSFPTCSMCLMTVWQ